MSNPRAYPDDITSAETGRTLRRGVKALTIRVDGSDFTYGQPGWWASLDDPEDQDGQLTDQDNIVRAAARREARAKARHAVLSPLAIRAIREGCGLSQAEAARVFGGGAKAFEKYESGEVLPSTAMISLLLLAARTPEAFGKAPREAGLSDADTAVILDAIGRSSIGGIYAQIYADAA
jgi:HTH-type transcriptional regulator/antitoxin MqsA